MAICRKRTGTLRKAEKHVDQLLKENDFIESRLKTSERLVVLIHGYRSKRERLHHLVKSIFRELPDADIFVPEYSAWMFSNARLVKVAEELLENIDDKITERKKRGEEYREVLLVGHSVGALLVRKICVYARGESQDTPGEQLVLAAKPWASKVSRIVLLAGMNRGWNLESKTRQISIITYFWFLFLLLVTKIVRAGKLIKDARRGSPFVADLRVQWISLSRKKAGKMPATVQILGDWDDVVSEEDNVDLQSGASFIYRRVLNTNHYDIISFRKPALLKRLKLRLTGHRLTEGWKKREEEFLYALQTPEAELKTQYVIPKKQVPNSTISHVIFVMHGMRDNGFWTQKVLDLARKGSNAVECVLSSYGYFPILGFLLSWDRQRNVRWFMDRYTEAYAKYPKAQFGFIGHSNGTYLLGGALLLYPSCEFHNVVLAGSVLRRDFPWDSLVDRKRVKRVKNYIASCDWVIGLFSKAFEIYQRGDIGSAGFDGFEQDVGRKHAVAFVKGGHSAAIKPEIFEPMLDFVLGKEADSIPDKLKTESQPKWLVFTSRFYLLGWVSLVGLLGVGGYIVYLLWPYWEAMVIYSLGILLVLYRA